MATETKWVPNLSNQRVARIIPEEVENFADEVRRFRAGEWVDDEFTKFRLRQGIYGQRQPDRQMVRVKVPYGGITAPQLDMLGQLAERYAPLMRGHVTTRENVQYHHVSLDDVPDFLRMLADAGLTTREACGNTMRNVVSCAKAGVCVDQVFDVTPFAAAYARHFLRHPVTQMMPRKVKTAFSCGPKDCAITAIHDVGMIAKVQDGKNGFKVVMGGGLSIMPRLAPTLYEFVSADDGEYIRVTEAAMRVFNRQDEERKNRMKARIKFTIDRMGIDKFRELVEEELKKDWAKRPVPMNELLFIDDEERDAPPPPRPDVTSVNGSGPADFIAWKETNVEPQKQEGFVIVHVSLPRGDIMADQFPKLAAIARRYAGGRARFDQQQNIVFRWVRPEALYYIYMALKDTGLAEAGRHQITDVVTCPGTDSCKLGITSSMGLNKALREVLETIDISDPLVKSLHIKASGCPNSCGQHHIANIGFHGAAMKGEGGQVPAYELFLGGQYEDGEVKIGARIKTRVPARRAPDALKAVLAFYQKERQAGETFNRFVERVGAGPFEALLSEFKEVGALNRENIKFYMDWERTVLYKLERGEGECAV
ncbi:MAG: nitrite/sulfite reductase [Chloroflexi bacterium]|nr:nitrite/sulfite reductase [Chloroflexota bacterium]